MVMILKEKSIDELDTIKHVNSLAFERSAGGVGETRAIKYIQEILNNNNIESRVEYFYWSNPIRYVMKTIYLMALSYLLIFRQILIIILIFFVKYSFRTTRKISFTKKEQSKNLYTIIKAKNRLKSNPVIIFSAHYDSVASRIPYKLQKALLFIGKFIILPYIALSIFISIWLTLNIFLNFELNNMLFYVVSVFSLVGLSVIVPIFIFLFTSSESSGSIDNASGVAILIELTKRLHSEPLENYDVLFIWFGSEEWGLKGSKKFVKTHYRKLKRKYDLNKSVNINIDMVGSYIGLFNQKGLLFKKPVNKNLNKIIKESANKLDIPLTLYDKIIPPKSDYISFLRFARATKSNFQAACFHSDKDTQFIHSTRDTPDKCSNKNLNGCLNICYETILCLDSQIR